MVLTDRQAQIEKDLLHYKKEMQEELHNILQFWTDHVVDEKKGGFYGSVNNANVPDPDAPKGLVLNSRICWAFSAAYNQTGNEAWLKMATRAFDYIIHHFIDHEFGGAYWSVDANGNMLEGRKQIYGLAFSIYALSEYYKATRDGIALHIARDLYDYIEQYSLDTENGGYIEAFTREWETAQDLRLSDKDDNEKKTMNTHLHIIEAYACLYQVWPDKRLREQIGGLLEIFSRHLIDKEQQRLLLFFNDNWVSKSSLRSFGHDIEAAWLLHACAEISGYSAYVELYSKLAVSLAAKATEGLDKDGGLWYEYDPAKQQWIHEKHSWPQAEAMLGFFNAWQLSGNQVFLQHSINSWQFVKSHILDKQAGEWKWGVDANYVTMRKDKAGFWKCPYHNTRACLEIMRRISG